MNRLKRYLLEESYELLDAIDRQDDDNMIEELGDVLLQVIASMHKSVKMKECFQLMMSFAVLQRKW